METILISDDDEPYIVISDTDSEKNLTKESTPKEPCCRREDQHDHQACQEDELFERQTEFAIRLSLLEMKMGQGDEPPAKKCKWSWSNEECVSPCLSEIGNKIKMPQLIMRRSSLETFHKSTDTEVLSDELPDLEVDRIKKPSSPRKHPHGSSKHHKTSKHHSHRSHSRSDKGDRTSHNNHSNHSKHSKNLDRMKSNSEKHRASNKHSLDKNHKKHHSKHRDSPKHNLNYSASNHDRNDNRRHSKKVLKDNGSGKISGGERNCAQNLFSEMLHGGRKVDEKDISCSPIVTSSDCHYEWDIDRDSCDGRSDSVSSTGVTSRATSRGGDLKFNISPERKRRFAEVLKMSVRSIKTADESSKNSGSDLKRVRRVSADTSTHLLKSAHSCDSASDSGSVSSNSSRHFLDALSDIHDDTSSGSKDYETCLADSTSEDQESPLPSSSVGTVDGPRPDSCQNRSPPSSNETCKNSEGNETPTLAVPGQMPVVVTVKAEKSVLLEPKTEVTSVGAVDRPRPDSCQNRSPSSNKTCRNSEVNETPPLAVPGQMPVVVKAPKTEASESSIGTVDGPRPDSCLKRSPPPSNKTCKNSEEVNETPALAVPGRMPVVKAEKSVLLKPKTEASTAEAEATTAVLEDYVSNGPGSVKQELCSETEREDFTEGISVVIDDQEMEDIADPCPSSPFSDTDSLPDLDAPVVDCNAFEDDLECFSQPLSFSGDGRVIHLPPCNQSTFNFLKLRCTHEFTAVHTNAIEANFQEENDTNALELIVDFTTSIRAPRRQLIEKVLNDVLLPAKIDARLKYLGYDVLAYVHQLHPPDHRLPFPISFTSEIMDRCERLLKGGATDADDNELLGIILAMQYCVAALEAELMSRKLGSRRDIQKSIIARWFSLEVSFGRVENLLSWFKLAVEFDNLVRSRSSIQNKLSNVLGFHKSLLGELQKLLCLAVSVSTDPSAHCVRLARSLCRIMDCWDLDDVDEEVILRSLSSPLLNAKVAEMQLVYDVGDLSESFGKNCTGEDVRHAADYFQALWKVEEENLTLPLNERVLMREKQRDHGEMRDQIRTFLENAADSQVENDDVHLAQLECQLEALNLS